MRHAVRFVPAAAIMALIFALSAQPDLGTGLGGWDFVLRKLGHMAVFGALFAALVFALRGRPAQAAAIALLYAISDEWHQSFVDGRHGTPVDVLIDGAGIGLAWVLMRRCGASSRRRGTTTQAPAGR